MRPPLRLEEGRELARDGARAARHLRRPRPRRRPHRRAAPAAASSIELDRVPLAEGAELDDLGFGEDYELLAAVPRRRRLRRDRPLRGGRGRRAAARTASRSSSAASSTSGGQPAPRLSQAANCFSKCARGRAPDHGLPRGSRPRRGSPSAARAPRARLRCSGCSSMLTVTKPTRSPCSASSSSSALPTALHGPHQGAQKSTHDGPLRREHVARRTSRR